MIPFDTGPSTQREMKAAAPRARGSHEMRRRQSDVVALVREVLRGQEDREPPPGDRTAPEGVDHGVGVEAKGVEIILEGIAAPPRLETERPGKTAREADLERGLVPGH